MKKKVLAMSVLAAVSSQAGAFQFDTGEDWSIRWDNTLKGNVTSRVNEAQSRMVDPAQFANARLFDDADYSVNRKSGGITSSRFDIISELDVIWREDFGFRVSGAGWYDAAYENSDNPQSGTLPNGLPYDYSWAGLSYKPGEYSSEAEEMQLLGGELLDAFVFGNWTIGDAALGVRAGRHTIYWGQSLLAAGAITGIAGSMAALDQAKGLSVPGSEAKELFMPATKISSSLQLTDNLSLSGYYEFEHLVHRYPATGTWWSPTEVITDNGELAVLVAGTATAPRVGYKVNDDKITDSGEFGLNLSYTIEALGGLETQFVWINGSDRNLSGVYGASGGLDPAKVAQWLKPWDQGGANARVIGTYGWVYREDIDTFGISLGKQMFDISFGMDVVYRKDTGLNPEFLPSFIGRPPGTTPADYSPDPDQYPGPTGDVWGVVINGLGFLSPDWGLWDGGTYIVEITSSWLDEFGDNQQFAKNSPVAKIGENRVTTQIGAVFKPTWYQVFPGWDMSLPMALSYGIDGEQPPQSFISQEELGNAAVGVEFDVNQAWLLTARYSHWFGPVANGVGGGLVDRDNVSLTVKRTF